MRPALDFIKFNKTELEVTFSLFVCLFLNQIYPPKTQVKDDYIKLGKVVCVTKNFHH